MNVPQSVRVHANQADEVYYRVGDKSKKLNFDQRMQLVYAKGEHYYEDAPVNNACLEDKISTCLCWRITSVLSTME